MALRHVAFTGGGTAGHVVPALPVIDALLAEGVRVSYIGSTSGLEERLLGTRSVTYHGISTGKLRRYFSWENVRDIGRVLVGMVQAIRVLGSRPQLVFSKGGFVSFPVVFAAWLRRIPVVAHESDQTPGLANRLAFPFVRCLCTNFPEARVNGYRGRIEVTGTPIRPALLHGDAQRGREFLGSDGTRPLLVVTGGSLGAEGLNARVRDALPELLPDYEVVHLCGAGKLAPDMRQPGYHQFEFLDAPWGDVLAAADAVVSRAGANTLYELLALQKPNLLVPLPASASRGDQLQNAAYARHAGYSLELAEEALDAASLRAAVDDLTRNAAAWRERLRGFDALDATQRILQVFATL